MHLVLSLVLRKPTKSRNSYYYYSASDMQVGAIGIKEQELGGWSDSEGGFKAGRGLSFCWLLRGVVLYRH